MLSKSSIKAGILTAIWISSCFHSAAFADIQIQEAGPLNDNSYADYTLLFNGEDARTLHSAFGPKPFNSGVMLQSISCTSEDACTVVARSEMLHPQYCRQESCPGSRWRTNYGVDLRPIVFLLSKEDDRALISPIQFNYFQEHETYVRNHALLYDRMSNSRSSRVARSETERGTVLRMKTDHFSLGCIQYKEPATREQSAGFIPLGPALKPHFYKDTHFCFFTAQLRLAGSK